MCSSDLEAQTQKRLRERADELRQLAEQRRAQAQANFQQACQAVDSLLDRIGGARLAHEPRLELLRKELRAQGRAVNAKRIARLMRANAIRGVSRRRGFVVTTRRDKSQDKAPDLVQRCFEADGPDKLWVADMTYVPTWAGFIYLAVVLDGWSRRVVGWAIGHDMTGELVLSALNMALQQRKPRSVIHHSDQGSQYTSLAFGKRCKEMGVKPSMGSVGDAYDNAMAESFFATLECELIDRRSWPSKAEARLAVGAD